MQRLIWGFFPNPFDSHEEYEFLVIDERDCWLFKFHAKDCLRIFFQILLIPTMQEIVDSSMLTIEVLRKRCLLLLQNPADYWSFTQKMLIIDAKSCWLLHRRCLLLMQFPADFWSFAQKDADHWCKLLMKNVAGFCIFAQKNAYIWYKILLTSNFFGKRMFIITPFFLISRSFFLFNHPSAFWF